MPGVWEELPFACPTPALTTPAWRPLIGVPFTLTFTAAASALYRISRPSIYAADGTSSYGTRVLGVPPASFDLFHEDVYALEAGRNYTFSMEVQVTPTCRPITIQVSSPFAIEQLN